MEKFSQVLDQNVLFQIGIELDLPDLLGLCQSNKEINRKLCKQDDIWNYRLKKDFNDYLDFTDIDSQYPIFQEIYQRNKREYYTLLYKLNRIKTAWNLKYNLYELYNLPKLYLDENKIESIPKEVGMLHNLQRLYLSGNQIESIPKEIGQLHNLQILHLARNKIESIPKEIGQLHNLQTLLLNNNNIVNIPKEIGQLHNLQILHLQNNQIVNIPKEIGQLNDLKFLALGNNQIREIPKEIGELHNLKFLSLYENPIKNKVEVRTWIKQQIPNISI